MCAALHSSRSFVIDGTKVVLLRGDDPEVKVEEHTFEVNEVYAIDVIMSSADGKPRETEVKSNVYKLAAEATYRPKGKASIALLRDVTTKFSFMPFTLRALDMSEAAARMGVVELVNHGVFQPYPVLQEREGALIAHVKFTVLLLPGGTLKIAGLELPPEVASDVVCTLSQKVGCVLYCFSLSHHNFVLPLLRAHFNPAPLRSARRHQGAPGDCPLCKEGKEVERILWRSTVALWWRAVVLYCPPQYVLRFSFFTYT